MINIINFIAQKEKDAIKQYEMFQDKRVRFVKTFYIVIGLLLVALTGLDIYENTLSLIPIHCIRICCIVISYLLVKNQFYYTSIYLALTITAATNYYGALYMETFNTFHLNFFIFGAVIFYLTKNLWVNIIFALGSIAALIHIFYNQTYYQTPHFSAGIAASILISMVLFFGVLMFIVKEFSWLQEALKMKNDQMVQSNEELYIKNEQLKESNEFITKLLSIVAHDLRNPFNHIIGFSNLLYKNLDKYDNKRKNEFIEQIVSSSETGYQILENIMGWARSQSHKIELKNQNIYLSDLLQSITEEFQIHCQQKNIEFERKDTCRCVIKTDATLLSIILRNLCSNAVKFSPTNSKIKIDTEENGTHCEISVINEGSAISTKSKEQILDRNWQYSSTGTAGEKGSGLGIAISLDLADRLNAKLTISSQITDQTEKNCFTLSIPKNSL